MTKPELQEVVGAANALVGLAGSVPQWRAEAPSAEQEASYQALSNRLATGLARLSDEHGKVLANPNQHPTLKSVWNWAWTLGDGRARKEAGKTLLGTLTTELQGLVETLEIDDGAMGSKEQLLPQVEASLATGKPTAVVFIDLDGFKAVNDTHGHDVGDSCLDAVIRAIGEAIDKKGRLFRNGGDEFVVLLPNSTSAEAIASAERVREEIERAAAQYAVTASVGVASTDVHPVGAPELVNLADQAMYVSKKAGKNRATYAEKE